MSFDLAIPSSGGDDTAALQAAIDVVRAANGGRIVLENKEYKVGGLNCTNLSGLEIVSMPNTRVSPVYMTTTKPVFNFDNSSNWALRNLEIYASGARPEGIAWPSYAVYARNQDKVVIDRVRTPGKFLNAAVAVHGVASVTFYDCQLSQFDEQAPTLAIDSIPGMFAHDICLYNTELHQGGANGSYTLALKDCTHFLMSGGICDNSKVAHVKSQGNLRNVSFESVKFYSELGSPSQAVLECYQPDSISFLRITNPFRDGIPMIAKGNGVDTSTLRIDTP